MTLMTYSGAFVRGQPALPRHEAPQNTLAPAAIIVLMLSNTKICR